MSDGLEVRGGFAGTAARVADLLIAAGALARGADESERAARSLEVARYAVAHAPAATAAEAAARARALDELWEASAGCRGARAYGRALADAADRLARTAAAYAEAERDAGLLATAARFATERVGEFAALGRWSLGTIWNTAVRNVTVTPPPSVGRNPERDLTQAAIGALGDAYVVIVAAVTAATTRLAQVFGSSEVVSVRAGDARDVAAPSSVADVIAGVAALEPRHGAPDGTVSITSIVHADGTRTWVVEVPGTEEWVVPGGRNTLDAGANPRLVVGNMADSAVGVAAAMRAAGIPAGEPVMIAGHSQGGIVAAVLAASPAVRAEFNVRAIVTAGSPTGLVALPDDVAALQLEHQEDVVPALDGVRNPDTPTRVTVSRDLSASRDLAERAAASTAPGAHLTEAYFRTAALADASADASVARWRADAAAFFATEGSRATVTLYTIDRADLADAMRTPADGYAPSVNAG